MILWLNSWPLSTRNAACFFFFNDTPTTEIYTLSLHDALPICPDCRRRRHRDQHRSCCWYGRDRKSTRLNSSHVEISYAVFCLKKKTDSRIQYYDLRSHPDLLSQITEARENDPLAEFLAAINSQRCMLFFF